MSTPVSRLYRQEALRQTKIAMEVIDGIVEVKALADKAPIDLDLDVAALKKLQTLLRQEARKLVENEATVAVVGPMKAGKSTVISAIVGAELMPSRDEPMTTFPTIVTHTPGQITPVLTFPLAEPFGLLAAHVAADIRNNREKCDTALLAAEGAAELTKLADKLLRESLSFPASVEGQEAICALLTDVNDLSRLAKALEVSRDIVDSALNFESLPRVNVQFEHVTDVGDAGKLSFVDTPGPDEAKDNERLKKISREQLEQASAIVLVTNYLLEGGEAVENVRALLDTLPAGAHERLYVLANKYDQRMQHDNTDEEATAEARQRVRELEIRKNIAARVFERFGADALADGHNRVFLTSARHALIANLARRAVRINGALPRRGWWPRQFLADAGAIFTAEWLPMPDFRLTSGVLVGADALWRESRFELPLKTAVETAARNLPLLLVKSCLDKLRGGEIAHLYQMLGIRAGSFHAETELLRSLVADLTADLTLLRGIKEQVQQRLAESKVGIRAELEDHFDKALAAVSEVIDIYMNTGDPALAQETFVQKRTGAVERFFNFVLSSHGSGMPFFKGVDRGSGLGRGAGDGPMPERSYLAGAPDLKNYFLYGKRARIRVNSPAEARQKSNAIFDTFQGELNRARNMIAEWTYSTLANSSHQAKASVDDSFRAGWSKVQDHIKEITQVEIEPPDIGASFNVEILFGEEARSRGTNTETRSYFVTYDRPGNFAAVARYFGGVFERPTWGKGTKIEWTTDYYIDIEKIRGEIVKESDKVKTELLAKVDEFALALDASITDFANKVERKVEHIHGYIEEERRNRDRDADAYAEVRDRISALAAQAQDLKQEATALRLGAQ